MNIILTIVLFVIGYTIGFPSSASNLPADATVSNQAVIIIEIPSTVPAAQSGLTPGDEIIQINGQSIQTIKQMQAWLQHLTIDQPAAVLVKRGNEQLTITVPVITLDNTGRKGLGVQIAETGTVRLPLVTAIWYSTYKTYQLGEQILFALGGMIMGLFKHTQPIGEVSGPLGIASLTYQATQLGFVHVLQLAAILSINLAIFNLIPFPALDGGRILFLLLELILRRPVNQKTEAIVHNIGFVLLLLLIIAVTVKDVIRIF